MRYPVGLNVVDYKLNWYVALGFGEPQSYGYHEGADINKRSGGDSDLGELIRSIFQYKTEYYHFKSHLESGFGCHYVYKIEGSWGTRWVHCAHNMVDPDIVNKDSGGEGDVLSRVGKTGRPRNLLIAHLHFSIFKKDPQTLPNGIDTIAKTTQQLNDWWEDPIKFIEKYINESGPRLIIPDNLQTKPNKGDINPITDKAYAVNPATGVWDDGYWATVIEPLIKLQFPDSIVGIGQAPTSSNTPTPEATPQPQTTPETIPAAAVPEDVGETPPPIGDVLDITNGSNNLPNPVVPEDSGPSSVGDVPVPAYDGTGSVADTPPSPPQVDFKYFDNFINFFRLFAHFVRNRPLFSAQNE